MKKIFLGVYNPSIILTYIGVFCSVYGIYNLLQTASKGVFQASNTSVIMLILAGVCDMFDGTIARLCKRNEKEKLFGIQLDSLADVVSFVVFPAILLLFMTEVSVIGVFLSMLYIFAGIMRLGWFNVSTEENKGIYQGLPVTFSALIIPTLYCIIKILNLNFENFIIYGVWLILSILFILNFKLKKPSFVFTVFMAVWAITTTIFIAYS